jgi:hypothetical protein
MMPNNALAGWKKFALHFFGFGVPCAALVWFGGWSGAVVLIAWRAYEEYLDWHARLDTLPKALIDFFSQVLLTVIVAVIPALR